MKTATLPDKPSELIRVALADLRKVEAMPSVYRVDMNDWHVPHPDGVCEVCLAGAVMAQTFGAPPECRTMPRDCGLEVREKLDALDSFRSGDVYYGIEEMGCELPEDFVDVQRDITLYEIDSEGFHRDMQTLASDLEAAGL